MLRGTGRIRRRANSPLQATTGDNGVVWVASGVIAMKTIVSALIALSVLAGISTAASALDSKTFWEQQERQKF